jgi:Predicted transmembrane protein 161AB
MDRNNSHTLSTQLNSTQNAFLFFLFFFGGKTDKNNMALFNIYFVAVCLVVFVLYKLRIKNISITYMLLKNLRFFIPPTHEEIQRLPSAASVAATNAAAAAVNASKSSKKKKSKLRSRLSSTSTSTIDGPPLPSRYYNISDPSHLRAMSDWPMFSVLDDLLLLSTMAIILFLFSDIWVCLGGPTPDNPISSSTSSSSTSSTSSSTSSSSSSLSSSLSSSDHSSTHHNDFVFLVTSAVAMYATYSSLYTLVQVGWCSIELRIAFIVGIVCSGIAAMCLWLPDGVLDIYLHRDVAVFNQQFNVFLQEKNLISMTLTINAVRAILLVWVFGVSTTFTFPALRYAREYAQIIDYDLFVQDDYANRETDTTHNVIVKTSSILSLSLSTTRDLITAGTHANFLLPLFVAVLWINPLVKDLVVMDKPDTMLTSDVFDSFRMSFTLLASVVRMFMFRSHIQAYLGSAFISHQLVQATSPTLQREAAVELDRRYRQNNGYFPTAAIQYLSPLIASMLLTLMNKRKSDIPFGVCEAVFGNPFPIAAIEDADEAAAAAAAAMVNFSIVNNALVVSILSFMVFWVHASWMLQSALSLLYLRKFQA